MVPPEEPGDLITLACRRETILNHLAAGPCGKADLDGASDTARSTLERGIAELERAAVIEHCPDGYRLTLYGRIVYELVSELRHSLSTIGTHADVLRLLPRDAALDSALLRTGRIRRADAARRELARILGGAGCVCLVLAGHPPGFSTYAQYLQRTDRLRVVLPESSSRRLATANGDSESAIPEDVETVDLRETSDPPSYTLVVADHGRTGTTAICGHVEGSIGWLLSRTDEPSVTWGISRFEECWTASTPLPFP